MIIITKRKNSKCDYNSVPHFSFKDDDVVEQQGRGSDMDYGHNQTLHINDIIGRPEC